MLQYIDDHIKEKLSVEKLAARAGFSPYHFCRVFQWEVGVSLMEYVRNRKLNFAASELNSEFRIIDIAIEYGFERHSGFSKAFRRYFGCTPELYRIHASATVPKMFVLEKTKRYNIGGVIMEPKMLRKAAVKIAGFAIRTNSKDGENLNACPNLWKEYVYEGRQKKLHSELFIKSHAEYGACFPKNPENGEFEYAIGIEVKDGHDIPKEYHVCTIPEALYAVFSTPPTDEANFTSSIQGMWKYIFSEWFPNSGYEFMENGVDFEYYDERCQSETGKIMDIYIPVVKRSDR
jgi:AraC family transcriptional regulator